MDTLHYTSYTLPKQAGLALRENIQKLHVYADESGGLVAVMFCKEAGFRTADMKTLPSKEAIKDYPLSNETKKHLLAAKVEEKELPKIKVELDAYFLGERKEFSMPMKLYGTAFQKKVWEKLLTIPLGKTISYKDLAGKIDENAKFYRAIGGAVGKNPLCVIVPCHRVLPNDSVKQRQKKAKSIKTFELAEVGKFGGGSTLKQELLNFEALL